MADNTGAAILGVANLDGAGNVSGSYRLQLGSNGTQPGQGANGTFTGTYSTNADGTGTLTSTFDQGFGITFATVITEGGQGMRLVATDATFGLGGGSNVLRGPGQTITGNFSLAPLLGSPGDLPLSLTSTNGNGVYTATSGGARGTVQCGDGTTQNWTANVVNATVLALRNDSTISGDYLMVLSIQGCGDSGPHLEKVSGQVTGNVVQNAINVVILHGNGLFITGTARAIQTSSLNGSYGYHLDGSPLPSENNGVLKFDGAGNVTMSLTLVGSPGNSDTLPVTNGSLAGNYTIDSDGSGTINLSPASDQPPTLTLKMVITDRGSTILLLRTNGAGQNIVFGTARLQ